MVVDLGGDEHLGVSADGCEGYLSEIVNQFGWEFYHAVHNDEEDGILLERESVDYPLHHKGTEDLRLDILHWVLCPQR